MTKHWSAAGAVLLLLLSGASALSAQVGTRDTTEVVPLQPVLVNVLRTPFPLTTAPFAVAANTEAEVQRGRPGIGVDDALRGIPGVQVDDRHNYAQGDRISIRGFGARTQFGIRGVKVLVDGIPATLPDGQTNLNHLDLGFLRRAEVIRGPASSLYGNAAGGVIQFETELPPAVPISQSIGVLGGSDGLLRLNSTTGGSTGGTSYLLNVSRLTYDGYREYHAAETTQLNGSVGLRAGGGDLRVSGSYVDYDGENPGSLDLARLAADRTQACCRNPAGQIQNNLLFRTRETGHQGQLGAFWQAPVGEGALEIAAYGINRVIDNPIPNDIIDLSRNAGGVRALYHSTDLPARTGLRWSAGVEGDVQSDDRQRFRNVAGDRGALTLDQQETVLDGGLFGQVSGVFEGGLNALAGLRFDVTRFEADDRFVESGNPDDSGSRTMTAISPSVGLSYEVARALALYGNVATSFETPTTTELVNRPSGAGGFNPELEPQRAVSFEAGAKGLLTGRASYQLSVYRANISNSLIPFEIAESPGRSFYRNAGSAVHQGVEAGVSVAPLAGIRADVAYTFTDARFDDYTDEGGNSFDGNRIPGVSPHRLDGSLSYQAPFGLFANLEARYQDNLPVNDRNTFVSPAFVVVDFRTGLDEVGVGGMLIEPFVGVTNLFDEEYNTSVTVNAFGSRYFEPGPGRSFYVGGEVRRDWP